MEKIIFEGIDNRTNIWVNSYMSEFNKSFSLKKVFTGWKINRIMKKDVCDCTMKYKKKTYLSGDKLDTFDEGWQRQKR